MNNKYLITLLVLSLSLAAFLAGYVISQKDFTKQSANIGGGFLEKFDESRPDDLGNSSGDLFTLSKRTVLSPTLSKEKDSVLYYDKNSGQVFEAGPGGLNEKIISNKLLPDLIATFWSPNKKEVVSVFDTNNGKDFRYYNYQTNKSTDLWRTIVHKRSERLAHDTGTDGTKRKANSIHLA